MENEINESLIFGFYYKGKLKTSENTISVIRLLNCNLEFRNEVLKIRKKFNLSAKNYFEPQKAISTFEKEFKKWNPKLKEEYYKSIKNLADIFNLNRGWVLTLKYFVGSAFLIEPLPDVLVEKSPHEIIRDNYVSLLIGINYSQDELISVIRRKWKEIKSQLATLPKQTKITFHKKTLGIMDYVISMRDIDKKSFPQIASKIEKISSDHPDWFCGNPIILSDSEVRQIYYRQKKKVDRIIVTKTPK